MIVLLLLSSPTWAGEDAICHPKDLSYLKPSQSGYVQVGREGGDDLGRTPVAIYWEKYDSRNGPAKGSVFFLAGGPYGHYRWHSDTDPHPLRKAFDDYDFYMFDWRGLNCSGLVTDPKQITGHEATYSPFAHARDFVELKNALVGEKTKVVLFGGSYGGITGSIILSQFPEHVSGAVLFVGPVDQPLLDESIRRFDHILGVDLAAEFPADYLNLFKQFKEQLKGSSFILHRGLPTERTLTPELFEGLTWLTKSQSVPDQKGLYDELKRFLSGDISKLDKDYQEAYLDDVRQIDPDLVPPAIESALTKFQMCKIWAFSEKPFQGSMISSEGVLLFWRDYCADYAYLSAPPAYHLEKIVRAVDAPVLAWFGDRDWFDPEHAAAVVQRFGAKTETHIMKGWAHDYGPDRADGINRVIALIQDFLKRRKP